MAFLRGLNLGNRRVKMDTLRGCVEELDVEEVATFLASGNVIFEPVGDPGRAELEERLQRQLERSLGYPVDTFVRTMDELSRLLDSDAVSSASGDEELNPQVIFLRDRPGARTRERLAALETADDGFEALEREVLWLRRGGLSDAPISPRDLEGALGGPRHTVRTLNTVRRIVRKFGGGG